MTGSADAIFMFPIRTIALFEPDVLQLGDFGFAVQKLQEKLIQFDFYDGPIDGYFSEETEQSLRQCQASLGIKVTGQCDTTTWQALETIHG